MSKELPFMVLCVEEYKNQTEKYNREVQQKTKQSRKKGSENLQTGQ